MLIDPAVPSPAGAIVPCYAGARSSAPRATSRYRSFIVHRSRSAGPASARSCLVRRLTSSWLSDVLHRHGPGDVGGQYRARHQLLGDLPEVSLSLAGRFRSHLALVAVFGVLR